MSVYSELSEVIMEKPKTIKCLMSFNNPCLKCDAVFKEMVSIGAFIMCPSCFKEEFGVNEIEIGSKLHEDTYKKWLKIYQNKVV